MEAELATINNIIDELVILIYKLLEDNEYLEYRLSNLEEDYLWLINCGINMCI